jgi:cupin fold WbuC family metalloprotein
MIIDKNLLDQLTTLAQASPRLRQHFDLRNSPEDNSQRILNALEPGTVLPIHRHLETSETVVMLRGKGRWNYYDDNGNMTGSFLLSADGNLRGLSVPKGQWHNVESLESGTVILECKDGAWRPLEEEDIMNESH